MAIGISFMLRDSGAKHSQRKMKKKLKCQLYKKQKCTENNMHFFINRLNIKTNISIVIHPQYDCTIEKRSTTDRKKNR